MTFVIKICPAHARANACMRAQELLSSFIPQLSVRCNQNAFTVQMFDWQLQNGFVAVMASFCDFIETNYVDVSQ